jgi:hypothetical protein
MDRKAMAWEKLKGSPIDRKAMSRDKLILFKRLQKYKKKKGKVKVYSIMKALGEWAPHRKQHNGYLGEDDPVVREICERRAWTPQEVAVIMAEMRLRINKKGLKILEPKNDPCGYAWIEDVFGDVKQFERMSQEIRILVLKGEVLEKHKRRLQRKYHLYPEKLAKPGVPQTERNPIVKDHWEWIAKEYKDYTADEKRLELEARELYDKKR